MLLSMSALSSERSSFHAMAKGGSHAVDVFRNDPAGAQRVLLGHLGMGDLSDVSRKILVAVRRETGKDVVQLLRAIARRLSPELGELRLEQAEDPLHLDLGIGYLDSLSLWLAGFAGDLLRQLPSRNVETLRSEPHSAQGDADPKVLQARVRHATHTHIVESRSAEGQLSGPEALPTTVLGIRRSTPGPGEPSPRRSPAPP